MPRGQAAGHRQRPDRDHDDKVHRVDVTTETEQSALVERFAGELPAALLAPAPTGVVRVDGEDRASFLEAVLSQRVEDLRAGEVRGALYLDAKGTLLSMMDVVAFEDHWLLLLPDRDTAAETAEQLGGRTFLADARFALTDDAVWRLRGTAAREVAERTGVVASPGTATTGEVLVVGRTDGVDLVASPEALDPVRARLRDAGAVETDGDALERWRIVVGEPVWGREVEPPHLPEELGLLPTHTHLDKGCFPGQEAIARMWMLGRPRRCLARVRSWGEVDAGWETGRARRRTRVTSLVRSDHEGIGLAFVPPDATPGARFGDDDAGVEVLEILGAGRPVPGHNPEVQRRRDRRDDGGSGG